MRKFLGGFALLLILMLVGLLGLRSYQSSLQPSLSSLDTPFKGVHLIGGQVYYGKLENAYSNFPVLKHVYVIQNQADPKTQEVRSSLVKVEQGRIILNTAHIVLIEPVKPDTPLGKLIEQNEAAR
jgi:hypothetical protein